MLLQALYKYATEHKLLDRLPFQSRTLHLLISLNADGSPRGDGFVPLSTPIKKKTKKGETTTDKPGLVYLLPRYPGEKNNTKAQYLADPLRVALGLDKNTLQPLPDETPKRVPDAVQQFRMFWRWIEEADARLDRAGRPDRRLRALLAFRANYLGRVRGWVGEWTNPQSRTAKPVPAARLTTGGWHPLKDGDVVGFEFDGNAIAPVKGRRRLIDLPDAAISDPLWKDWQTEFDRCFREEVAIEGSGERQPSVCLLTGDVGRQIAKNHRPEIKITGTPPKGAMFLSIGSPAFESYGLDGGANASVSIEASTAYALALEDLLAADDASFEIGNVTFCFWAEKQPKVAGAAGRMMNTATPAVVADFLKAPFAGIERSVAKKDWFLSVALSANGGRVVVREWLRVPLDEAIENFRQWFLDLEIVSIGDAKADAETGPYSLLRLAYAVLPKAAQEKPDSPRAQMRSAFIGQLYSHALRVTPPSLDILQRLLREFVTALIKNNPKQKKPTFPLSQSRFALLKLILLRHERQRRNLPPTEDVEMPKAYLADTPDPAYNIGRLLMILSELQKKARKSESDDPKNRPKGPGIVERYYGEASAAPATAFTVLWKLHHHHLQKLSQTGDNGDRVAAFYRNKIGEIAGRFPPDPTRTDGAPQFPRQLDLEAQGRFALGFYQQRAHDRIEALVRRLLRDAKTKIGRDRQAALDLLSEAKRVAEKHGYDDLIELVERSFPTA